MARGAKTGGRQKGTLNKNSALLKDMILQALDGAGGVGYLQRQAEENSSAFLTLVGKVLPTQMEHKGDLTVTTKEQRDAAVAAATRANS